MAMGWRNWRRWNWRLTFSSLSCSVPLNWRHDEALPRGRLWTSRCGRGGVVGGTRRSTNGMMRDGWSPSVTGASSILRPDVEPSLGVRQIFLVALARGFVRVVERNVVHGPSTTRARESAGCTSIRLDHHVLLDACAFRAIFFWNRKETRMAGEAACWAHCRTIELVGTSWDVPQCRGANTGRVRMVSLPQHRSIVSPLPPPPLSPPPSSPRQEGPLFPRRNNTDADRRATFSA